MAGLTEKMEAFIEHYLICGVGAEAARRAGYSVKGADVASARLLGDLRIQTRIAERMKPVLAEKEAEKATLIADADEVLTFLSDMMRGKILEQVPILVGGGEQNLVDAKPNAASRNRAAELIGRKHKLFTDRTELEGTMTVQIVDDIPKGAE